MSVEQARRLDEVQAMEPALPTKAAAVRRLIDSLEDGDIAPSAPDAADAAAGKEATLRADDVEAVLDLLRERTRAYSELSKQVRAVGNNANQLTKLGHQCVTLGAAGTIPVAAVEALARGLEQVHGRLSALAHQDSYVEGVVRACR